MSTIWALFEQGDAVFISCTTAAKKGDFRISTGKYYGEQWRAAADDGASESYRCLLRDKIITTEYAVIYASEREKFDNGASGYSAGLAFALAFACDVACNLHDKDVPDLAATGVVKCDTGEITRINGINEKLRAASKVLPECGLVFYPSANDGEIEEAVKATLEEKKITCHAVKSVEEALIKLGILTSTENVNPYRGLEGFKYKDAQYYHGRTKQIQTVTENLKILSARDQRPFIMINGFSGVGKSSFVQAGLLPYLTQHDTITGKKVSPCVYRVGEEGYEPLEGLCFAIVNCFLNNDKDIDSDAKKLKEELVKKRDDTLQNYFKKVKNKYHENALLVIVIDQFEELFDAAYQSNRESFIDSIEFLVRNEELDIWVIGTLRSAFLATCQHHDTLIELMYGDGQYTLMEPSDGEIELMITGPANVVGVKFGINENKELLSTQITNEFVEGRDWKKGGLLQLSLFLQHLFKNHTGDEITWDDYRILGGLKKDKVSGGLKGYLTSYAKRCYKDFEKQSTQNGYAKEEVEKCFSAVFSKMITITKSDQGMTEITREIARSKWNSDSLEGEMVTNFIEKRLLVSDKGYIRLAHLSLLKGWERLEKVVNDNSDFWEFEERTKRQAVDYEEGKGGLIQEKNIQEAMKWLKERRDDLYENSLYIEKSNNAVEKQIEERNIAEKNKLLAMKNFGLALLERAKQAAEQCDFDQASYYSALAYSNLQSGAPAAEAAGIWLKAIAQPSCKWSSTNANNYDPYVSGSVAFSPDGRTLVDNNLRLWDVASGKVLSTLQNYYNYANGVGFSPNGKIVSGFVEKTVCLWDVASGTKLATLQGHSNSVKSVAFAPDGQTVVSGSADNTVRLWDVASGEVLATLQVHSYVNSVAFSPDGQTVVSGSDDGTVRIWDVTASKTLFTLHGHGDNVRSVAFSPDGQTVVSGSDDRTARIWDIASGKMLSVLRGHTNYVTSVAFSPDGQTVVSGSTDETTRMWDVASSVVLAILKGYSNEVCSVAFSQDGKTLASGFWGNVICLWDVISGEVLTTLQGHSTEISSVAFSPDGKIMISCSVCDPVTVVSWYKIVLWDVASTKVLSALDTPAVDVRSVAFSPDGKTVACGGTTVKVWDVASGEVMAVLNGHSDRVLSVAFSPDGQFLVSGSMDTTACLWNVTSGAALATLQGDSDDSDSVYCVAFSPDGKTVALAGGRNGTVRLWNVAATGSPVTTLQSHSDGVYSVAFSPDGKTVVSGSDKAVRLWDVASGVVLASLDYSGNAMSVAFSPDSQTVVSGSADNTVRLWDVASGEVLAILKGHFAAVPTVAFSPDGKIVVSGSDDKFVRIWNLHSLQKLTNETQRNQWIAEKEQIMGYCMNGLDIRIARPDSDLNGSQTNITPHWSQNHPFHWLPSAEKGNPEAMLQLGIIHHSDAKWDKAKSWYQKALDAGHQDAKERLSVLEKTRKFDLDKKSLISNNAVEKQIEERNVAEKTKQPTG